MDELFTVSVDELILRKGTELEDIFCELRGLLKEHHNYPMILKECMDPRDIRDTDDRLREWLQEISEEDLEIEGAR